MSTRESRLLALKLLNIIQVPLLLIYGLVVIVTSEINPLFLVASIVSMLICSNLAAFLLSPVFAKFKNTPVAGGLFGPVVLFFCALGMSLANLIYFETTDYKSYFIKPLGWFMIFGFLPSYFLVIEVFCF